MGLQTNLGQQLASDMIAQAAARMPEPAGSFAPYFLSIRRVIRGAIGGKAAGIERLRELAESGDTDFHECAVHGDCEPWIEVVDDDWEGDATDRYLMNKLAGGVTCLCCDRWLDDDEIEERYSL